MASINYIKINEALYNNIDAIEKILLAIGCENITYNQSKKEYRCSRESGSNPSSVRVSTETLKFICFSTNERGDIYNLIMNKKKVNFPAALKFVVNLLNIKTDFFYSDNIILPFGGFYKKLTKEHHFPELEMTTYDASILEEYGLRTNMRFLRDGIDLKVQEKFHLGYDIESNRITIPQWSFNGELVGIMGRLNTDNGSFESRWLPIIPCSRSNTLFGYHQNYSNIQQRQLCVVVESEKGVMQMSSMGYNCGLATCTRHVSPVQERYLKALRTEKIILAYDQDIPEQELIAEATKLKVKNSIYANKVGYIYDSRGELMKLGSKCSPTDNGKKTFEKLVNKYTRWI